MAATADAYCTAIDSFLRGDITEEACYATLGADRFAFAATTPQGNPATPDNVAHPTHGWSGRGGYAGR